MREPLQADEAEPVDLKLMANSLQSRNTSLGAALGEGRKLGDVLAGRKQVTEGVFSVEALAALAALAKSLALDMPITAMLDQVLNHRADLDVAIMDLLARLARTTCTSRG